jgi:hypothetical protein
MSAALRGRRFNKIEDIVRYEGRRRRDAKWGVRRVRMNNERESDGVEQEQYVPLVIREARLARERRDDLWPYMWVNFVSMILLIAAAVIMAYRMGAQSCH